MQHSYKHRVWQMVYGKLSKGSCPQNDFDITGVIFVNKRIVNVSCTYE